MANKIKVLIVDDSLVFGRFLTEKLSLHPRIEVVGTAVNPYDALTKIPKLNPDIITLDVEMPRMNGIDFLKELLPKHPLPVILVSSVNVGVFDALSYGAVDFVRKPDMTEENSTANFVKNLSNKVLIGSNAKVKISSQAGKGGASGSSSAGSKGLTSAQRAAAPSGFGNLRLSTGSPLRLNATVIAIGASTGGTEATLQVLQQLPADTPGIVVTQHMPKGFTGMYADRLNRLCKMSVKEAEDGDVIKRGQVLIAPGGDLQMRVAPKGSGYIVRCQPGEKVNGHRPSVDILFQSMAQHVKRQGIGIILTGMGQDGAKGLLEMRKTGAYTIGQDRDSCVVYGMPMVANDIGAVCVQSSCANIASVLVKQLNNLK